MKITEFNTIVTKREGKRKEISVAQVAEVFKIVNSLLYGLPYFMVRVGLIRDKNRK